MQLLPRWIILTIKLCYELFKCPHQFKLHTCFTRAVASSTAFWGGVSLTEICRAATRKSSKTFVGHCALDLQATVGDPSGEESFSAHF